MSSVSGEDRCPRCGGVLHWDQDTRGRYWWSLCARCGRGESSELIWNDDGTPALDEAGRYQYEHTAVEGRGAYRLEPREGIASQLGSLGEDFRPDSLSSCFDMDAVSRHCDPAGSYIAYFDPETGAVSVLWGDAEPGLYVEDRI